MGGAEALVILVWIGVFWILPIIFSSQIWTNKGGGGGAGFALGFFLGWIGVLIAAIATPSRAYAAPNRAAGSPPRSVRECPHCKEAMRRDASVCPHCQRDSDPWRFHEGFWWYTREDGSHLYLDERKNEWIPFRPSVPSSRAPSTSRAERRRASVSGRDGMQSFYARK